MFAFPNVMRNNLTIFFWNLARRHLVRELAVVVKEQHIDILILAESDLDIDDLRMEIPHLSEPTTYSDRIKIFTTGDPSQVVPVFDDPARRLTVRRLIIPPNPEILLAAVHFFDKRNWSEDDQLAEATNLAADIVRIENRFAHSRTILVGDLNMNPFDKAVVAAAGLHGVMTRRIASGQTRTVGSRNYRFFYNPMWAFLGDRLSPPPGTYFHHKSAQIMYFWNLLDQVLIRPSLMDKLLEIRILDRVGERSLVNAKGRPSPSDHLPLLFRLQLSDGGNNV
jgi:hypothetical protein